MARTGRTLRLLDLLRGRRQPTSAQVLADELKVSVRTIYRDIAVLQSEGLPILAVPQAGYLLNPKGFLQPAEFSQAEAEAVLLGLRLVEERGSGQLQEAARAARRKLLDTSDMMSVASQHSAFIVAPGVRRMEISERLHDPLNRERRIEVEYRDAGGQSTVRTLWPIVLGLFEGSHVLAAYCELRQAYRHFRVDRIAQLTVTEDRLPKARRVLLAEWQRENGIAFD